MQRPTLTQLDERASACSRAVVEQPRAEYDRETGRVRRLTFDFNRNGRNDAVSIMDGTHIDHIELDFDEDGKVVRVAAMRAAKK